VVGRIFDEFTQASRDTALRFGGTGLGLTIVRKLLALYGTTIHVDSTPGEGSTFSFTLRLPLPARNP
jgi:signal transduction histidine kinase